MDLYTTEMAAQLHAQEAARFAREQRMRREFFDTPVPTMTPMPAEVPAAAPARTEVPVVTPWRRTLVRLHLTHRPA